MRPFLDLSLLFVFFFHVAAGLCNASEKPAIPPGLAEWESWVLYDVEEKLCPFKYDDAKERQCAWPSSLGLRADDGEGVFELRWLVFSEKWLPLPGGVSLWPRSVVLNDDLSPVISRNGVPHVLAKPGVNIVKGRFAWKSMPETIAVPANSALVELVVDGKSSASPAIDSDGRVWLKKRSGPLKAEDKASLRIFRLVEDSIPGKVESLLKIDVSGRAREIGFKDVMLDGSVAMELKSPLPARIDPDGGLLIQARPGRWEIRIVSRFEGPVGELGPVKGEYGVEIWSFQSRNHLRMVDVKGPAGVDPQQTEMPESWKGNPAFLMNPGETIRFEQNRRGNPDPAPDRLSLQRTLWLDFDGGGYTIRDEISGTLSRSWSLSMNPPLELGRVSTNGKDRLVTQGKDDGKPGVELRHGVVDLSADSRMARTGARIPAVGWDHDFQSVSANLNIGPGWRLIHVSGVDSARGTWFERWTLLDLFLVLVISLTVFKMGNAAWGALCLVALVSIFHEPDSPKVVWLFLLGAMALLRVLPDGWMKRFTTLWWATSAVALLIIAIPFMVKQARIGVYPQLEIQDGYRYHGFSGTGAMYDKASVAPMEMETDASTRSNNYMLRKKAEAIPEMQQMQQQALKRDKARQMALLNQDPDALIQTGPGLPDWSWRSFELNFNGPVDKKQAVRLYLAPPLFNSILSFARVVLLALLIFWVLDIMKWIRTAGKKSTAAVVLAMAMCLPFGGSEVRAESASASGGYPPPALLQELRDRLLKAPDCLPNCARIGYMKMDATPDRIRIELEIHAATKTGVPLPGSASSWLPRSVLIDGVPAEGLLRDKDGILWALIDEGVHNVELNGGVEAFEVVRLSLPLKPAGAEINAQGWDVSGAHPDGGVESVLQLTRLEQGQKVPSALESRTLPPFFLVERVFRLGLSWEVETQIKRINSPGVSSVLEIPLLDGESVASEGVRAKNGAAVVHMPANESSVGFLSTLEKTTDLTIEASVGSPWVESWILDASPIWHCELSGIPVIYHQDDENVWRPQWRPWPGEKVVIGVSRPEAVKGRMVTVDGATLEWTPGQRFSKASLSMTVRSSGGGRREITLPKDAALQLVKIDGASQPIGQEGDKVTIPLEPRKQTIQLEWNQPADGLVFQRAPRVDLGVPAVNARVHFQLPENRWILWTSGPRLGPAVLFWSYLVVIVIVAIGLGRETLTPLKTHQWLLLGLGLTQIPPPAALVVAGWLLALGYRKKRGAIEKPISYNFIQLLLIFLTFAALACLYTAIENGLLGIPQMRIAGNGSSDFSLRWTQDRIDGLMPQPWALTLHRGVYHFLMLAWALWLALSLLKWLRWGYDCIKEPSIWKKIRFRRKKDTPPPIGTGDGGG